MKYDLQLKGTVGYWNFNSDQVDNLLAKKDGQEVNILVDSLGGSLSEGLSISSAFRNHGNVHVHFRGMNASAATVAAMGAARVTMDKSAMFLVHKASYLVFEWDLLNADALKAKAEEYSKQASDLDKMDLTIACLYADRCKKDYQELLALMKEDKWLTSQEAVEWGFVDEVTDEGKPVRLTASVATAMASEGMPVPENMPIEADSLLVRLEQLFSRILNNRSTPSNQNPPIINQKINPMKKVFARIAAVIGLADAEMEANEDNKFAFTEKQLDDLEAHLQEMTLAQEKAQQQIAALQQDIDAKNQTIAEQQQTIVTLQAKPEPEPEPVRNTGSNADDAFGEYVDAVAEARKMSEMLG